MSKHNKITKAFQQEWNLNEITISQQLSNAN